LLGSLKWLKWQSSEHLKKMCKKAERPNKHKFNKSVTKHEPSVKQPHPHERVIVSAYAGLGVMFSVTTFGFIIVNWILGASATAQIVALSVILTFCRSILPCMKLKK